MFKWEVWFLWGNTFLDAGYFLKKKIVFSYIKFIFPKNEYFCQKLLRFDIDCAMMKAII